MTKRRSIPERIARGTKVQLNGCVVWLGTLHEGGYGRMSIERDGVRRHEYVHRVTWELANGPLPPGLQIDHLCRNRACCNPHHLEAVTQQENIRRGNGGQRNRLKTHCPQGHEYTDENTYRRPGHNARYCRKCCSRHVREFYERKRQAQVIPTGLG